VGKGEKGVEQRFEVVWEYGWHVLPDGTYNSYTPETVSIVCKKTK
jgi:hypothetical protein